MESSDDEEEEEDDLLASLEWITPQSKISAIYQSNTEKGIRKLCCELLDLKDAVDNLCGNKHSKYLTFLRISEEVVEMEQELIELQKHISTQGILVQDLMSGVCRELEEWSQSNCNMNETEQGQKVFELQDPLPNELEDQKETFLENLDILVAERKLDEAVEALVSEERSCPELNGAKDASSNKTSSYKSAFLTRKMMLEDRLIEITGQPSASILELKKAFSGLLKLGKGPLAHQLFLKAYGSCLLKNIETFLPSCSIYPVTNSATLSKLMFSAISLTTKESGLIFGVDPLYTNRVVQWAEWELESFVRLVKENAPSSETTSALRAASICVQASLSYCSMLEYQGLKFSKLLLVLLCPYVEEVFEMNFRRAKRMVLDLVGNDETFPLSPRYLSPLSSVVSSSNTVLTESGVKFMFIVSEIVEQLTLVVISHFGGTILTRISQLFDKYVDSLIKALPGPSEDEHLMEQREVIRFRVETDAEQLALLGTAFTVADELLPMAVSRVWSTQNENKEPGSGTMESMVPSMRNTIEFKDWRRHLQNSLDKLRDNFCRQYFLNFIYSRVGKTRLDAWIYLNSEGEDLFWDSDPLPTLPFQALFAKLQQLATVAGDVLLGREKILKILLARLTETMVMWLADEEEFWDVFEDGSAPLKPLGLQQLILDMHFIVEIAVCGGYPSRHVHQIASAIIARAIRTFSARGIDPQSALPEDEWFVDTAKEAINKLLLGTSGSEVSEIDEEHIIIHDETISDSDDAVSCPSTVESSESFASANMGESESPLFFIDPED